jgi:hypothetical protein
MPRKKTERIVLRWDAHEKSAPYESDRWAASDRGWLFAGIEPSPLNVSVTGTTYVCLGHYLDYERIPDHAPYGTKAAGKTVHAVSCVSRASEHFATPAEARAWIEDEAVARIASYFAQCHQGYEHRKAEIRALKVQPFRDLKVQP